MYNQPFSQPPGMFGAQSAMAQMQSAPSLPAGNPSAREYFNYSMATLSNAAMPQAMMPQGISSLVPQYQFGGGIGYSGDVDIDWGGVAAAMDSAQAQADADAAAADAANGGSDPGFDPGTSYETSNPSTSGGSGPGFDPGTSYATSNPDAAQAAQAAQDAFSPDAAMAEAAIAAEAAQAAQDAQAAQAAEDAQMQQVASDLNDLMSQMQDEAARGTFSRDDAASYQAQQEAQQALSGINQTNINRSVIDDPFSPDNEMAKEAILSKQAAEFNLLREAEGGKLYDNPLIDLPVFRLIGPRTITNAIGRTMPVQTVLANLPYVGPLFSAAMTSGIVPDNTFGDFPGDVPGLPSQSELDQRFAPPEPDLGDPDSGDPDSGDPAPAPPAAAPAYVPPVYQTYAGLGLPSISSIPPLRMVTVPISRFVV
jgi:hypothetical protein